MKLLLLHKFPLFGIKGFHIIIVRRKFFSWDWDWSWWWRTEIIEEAFIYEHAPQHLLKAQEHRYLNSSTPPPFVIAPKLDYSKSLSAASCRQAVGRYNHMHFMLLLFIATYVLPLLSLAIHYKSSSLFMILLQTPQTYHKSNVMPPEKHNFPTRYGKNKCR